MTSKATHKRKEMGYAKARKLSFSKKEIGIMSNTKSNKYNISQSEAMGGYYFYLKHYNSNPNFAGQYREPGYTFFADMLTYFPYYSGETLLNKLKGYENRMLNMYCKGNPQAYEVMIDSLNLLGWVIYEKVGGERDEVAEWLFSEYERLMYRDWKKYVSADEMGDIRYNLD